VYRVDLYTYCEDTRATFGYFDKDSVQQCSSFGLMQAEHARLYLRINFKRIVEEET
jgi:hypothetical protein